ncbi:MAG: FGGY-family carbohydrate kinase [Gemmataceae bacterium]|nr:FGGY-family carbohydrate kinase [Gemmataceae bacterium]MDW8265500.1 FGGY-family carbohydrate kinase [Gemmataceae bacterium]
MPSSSSDSAPRILALDVGTSLVKAAVLNVADGRPMGPVAQVPYQLDQPTPEAAEVPAERIWGAVVAAARHVTASGGDLAGIGLACMTPALVLLDAADRPLGPIWTHLDRRSRPAARQVWAAVGPEFLATVGNRPLPGGISVIAYRQQLTLNPYLVRRVRRYLHLNSWLGLKMTGECGFDPANASFSGLYHTVTDHVWSARWCDYFQVDPDWLPRVVAGDETLGKLRPAAAAEFGLPAGLPVKLGTADISSAMLAVGMRPGDLLHVVGTTQVLAGLTATPRPDPQRLTRLHGVGSLYVEVTHNPVGGAALNWLHRLCFQDQSEDEFFGRTMAAALERTTRVVLDPPYLGGDRLEIEAHRAAFRDLTLATDRLDLLAAVLEAMRRCHRRCLAQLGLGRQVGRVFLTGGAASVVRRLLPEYHGGRVDCVEEGSLRGVARLFASPAGGSGP